MSARFSPTGYSWPPERAAILRAARRAGSVMVWAPFRGRERFIFLFPSPAEALRFTVEQPSLAPRQRGRVVVVVLGEVAP